MNFTVNETDPLKFSVVVGMGIPGKVGTSGDTPVFTIGDVESLPPGDLPTVVITGTPEDPILNFGLPQGETGETGDTGASGDTPVFTIGTTTTLPAGSAASASITGTVIAPVLNLGVPKGDKGDTGDTGVAGKTILTTSGLPANGVGTDGDYAYDPTTMTMYGPKASGTWPAGIELVPNYLRVGAKLSNYNNCK